MSEELWSAFKEASDRSVIFIVRPNPNYQFLQKILQFIIFGFYISAIFMITLNILQLDGGIVIAALNTVATVETFAILLTISELIHHKTEINEIIF